MHSNNLNKQTKYFLLNLQERTKALGYIDSNARTTEQALQAMDEQAARRPPDNVNQVTIKLTSCSALQPRRDSIQPSAYCVYKFFDFADHVTSTVSGSNNPQFNDSQVYNIPMTADLDKYLKTKVGFYNNHIHHTTTNYLSFF